MQIVLLQNGSKFTSISVGHSINLKECYENLDLIPTKLPYVDHRWTICRELNFHVTWSTGWIHKNSMNEIVMIENNIIQRKNLSKNITAMNQKRWVGKFGWSREDVTITTSNKWCPMKQFVKAQPEEGGCFKYLWKQFLKLPEAKSKEDILLGTIIRKIMKDEIFEWELWKMKTILESFLTFNNQFFGKQEGLRL